MCGTAGLPCAARAPAGMCGTAAPGCEAVQQGRMKHATPVALDALEPLLEKIRAIERLTEKRRGVFYRGSSAFLHFHEDPAGFFADLKTGPAWQRLPATTPADRRALLSAIKRCL